MVDRLLTFLAPHPCYGCGKSGQLLCDNCKYNIVQEPFSGCLGCGGLSGVSGVCGNCSAYNRAWCVGSRHDVLEGLIDAYKFERVYDAHRSLADLLNEVTPLLPQNTIIVPVPTVHRHIRQRGYDHTALIARRLATLKNCTYSPLIERKTQSVQRGASRSERIRQAKEAFVVAKAVSSDVPYLIIDDVVTTGSTLRYAAQALRDAGAKHVWVAAIARQPSTK